MRGQNGHVNIRKLLEIFRPGKFTARNGQQYEFGENDLRSIADAYDPSIHIAPIVVGHPKHDMPAYGWINKLSFSEGRLRAEPNQVDPDFAEMVQKGRFKTISASFYPPDANDNPKPGAYYLRHVGFLGAQPPSVKGLKHAEFSEDEKSIIEFEEPYPSRWYYTTTANLFRRIRDYFIDAVGLEKADEIMPSWQVDELESAAAKVGDNNASFSEHDSTSGEDDMSAEDKQKIADLERENKKLKTDAAQFAEREKEIKEKELEQNKKSIIEFADGLIKAGKVLPKDKDGLVEFMCSLDSETQIAFGEGENKQEKTSADWVRNFLDELPVRVDFEERGGAGEGDDIDMSKPDVIAKQALEFAESEEKAGRPRPSASAAVQHVVKQKNT